MPIIRLEASSSSEPKDWANAFAVWLHPLARISPRISSAAARHSTTRSCARSVAASAIARSSATQHISFEYRKCRGSAADLPDALVGLPPAVHRGIGAGDEELPPRDGAGVVRVELLDQPVR